MLNNPVPVLTHYLQQADALLVKLSTAGAEGRALLDARLAPDMLPFANQMTTVVNFSLRIACPLAGRPVPAWERPETSLESLRHYIAQGSTFLQTLTEADFIGAEARVIDDRAGFADLSLPAAEFLYHYALPNFYFHWSMAFAIARAHGFSVGKMDFDGYHQYPHGFSFEKLQNADD
jgi:hypothetical protein